MSAAWHVKSQRQDTVLDDQGPGFMTVWEVTYVIDDGPAQGTQGMVRIPVDRYNAETVKATIDAAVSHVHAVANL